MTVRLLLLLALGLAGCRPDCTPRDPARPNLLLVTIDTLRADHLGAYGNERVATPHFDRLAREGRIFEQSYAVSHITLPSHASIMSSLLPSEHGILRNNVRPSGPVPTLPETLARAGWRTGAVVSVLHLGPRHPVGELLRPGFETYEAPHRVSRPFRAAEANERLFAWMRGVCREPFFAWVHYWDPHMPYAPPAPFDGLYYTGDPHAPQHHGMDDVRLPWALLDLRPLRGRLSARAAEVRALKRALGLPSRGVRNLVLNPAALDTSVPDPAERARLRRVLGGLADGIRATLRPAPDLSDWLEGVRDIRFPLARYAGEVTYVDSALGALRAELEDLGLADRTIVVVTADHGEGLGEHGIWFNHEILQEQHLRVPLVIWAPGRVAPGRDPAPVDGLDVAPTLLALAGVPAPPSLHGRDLLSAGRQPRPLVAEGASGRQVAILDDGWRLVRTLQPMAIGDDYERQPGDVELYERTSDPGETRNRAADETARVQALSAALQARIAVPRTPPPAGGVQRETSEALRALGYVE